MPGCPVIHNKNSNTNESGKLSVPDFPAYFSVAIIYGTYLSTHAKEMADIQNYQQQEKLRLVWNEMFPIIVDSEACFLYM